jgi:hypothetical protein
VNGLERPLVIFRDPNQLAMEDFNEIWDRAQPQDDGTWLPDPIDLLVSKRETGRDKDRADIIFLEGKIEADYLARLSGVSPQEAVRMLGRFLTPRVAEAGAGASRQRRRGTRAQVSARVGGGGRPLRCGDSAARLM